MKKRDFLKLGLLGMGVMAIPKKNWALDFYPTTTDKKWAVLFGTWCGTARDAGIWISEGMDAIADVFDVRENPDLSKYENIVIGGAIRAGKTPAELQDYLKKHKSTLGNKIKGIYAVCGNMRKPVGEEQYTAFIDEHLTALSGAGKVPSKVFLGRITWGLMEPEVRKEMQSFIGMDEYDNLNRMECLEFGREIIKKYKS